MQIMIYARDYSVTPALRDFIKRKLGFGVGRFADRISSVRVRLKDTNGPRGGVDQHCRIDIAMNSSGTIAAEATELDIHKAISVAISRVARRVGISFDRKRVARTRGANYPTRDERYETDKDKAYESVGWNGDIHGDWTPNT